MEFRNDFRRVDKECQFSRCVQGYPRYGSASISPQDAVDENIKQIPTDLYHQLSNLRTEQRDEYL